MKFSFSLLMLALVSLVTATPLHFDYELSRGRNMWTGMHRAVHYFDRFTLLTHRMSDIRGVMASNYAFNVDKDWSLSFTLKKTGPATNVKDGFMLLLSTKGIAPTEIDEILPYKSFVGSTVC